ncbi:MAG: AmmeMemoRadiSam system radical SAM enzyme [Coprothermobacterota bacterium]|nr:AmmeMemoRadiSam system radical SAM enzyme [Coprothermobacterota bacterium]
MTEHEAILYEKLERGAVHCAVCPRRCRIKEGQRGFCKTRENRGGILYALTYGMVSSLAVDPIEKKPLFHFHPGSRCLSLGSLGCNLRCLHCQNWSISQVDPVHSGFLEALSPEDCLRTAQKEGAAGIAWTYNEPTIWLEYTLDCAQLAKTAGLYTVSVTNGYITPEALAILAPWLDAYRVDLKGWSREFWQQIPQIPNSQPVFEAARLARQRYGLHLEVVTNVIPGWNDDETSLRGLARWISRELGDDTPWHLTRFFPSYRLQETPPTPLSSLLRGERIGREEGLRYIYLGNLDGKGENTMCPSCGTTLIERSGFSLLCCTLGQDHRCPRCGLVIPIVGAIQCSGPGEVSEAQ